MLLESTFHQLFCLKFSLKLVTKSYTRKQKWVFFSEHSVQRDYNMSLLSESYEATSW